jgi:hypothetical protein
MILNEDILDVIEFNFFLNEIFIVLNEYIYDLSDLIANTMV